MTLEQPEREASGLAEHQRTNLRPTSDSGDSQRLIFDEELAERVARLIGDDQGEPIFDECRSHQND